ncbi:MAG: hypothetical protein ACK5NT_04440 [Pyrinomonadaceae bacterium]
MRNKKARNTFFFVTTLSVYIGLVVVGSAPIVFAECSQAANPYNLSISTRSTASFTKVEVVKKQQLADALPFSIQSHPYTGKTPATHSTVRFELADIHGDVFALNNQVLVVSNLARASI